jgi:hypothetical protein
MPRSIVEPPDMLRINETIKKVLEWQRRQGNDDLVSDGVEVEDFILAVTCRHDDGGFPQPAQERLTALIKENCAQSEDYKEQVIALRGARARISFHDNRIRVQP